MSAPEPGPVGRSDGPPLPTRLIANDSNPLPILYILTNGKIISAPSSAIADKTKSDSSGGIASNDDIVASIPPTGLLLAAICRLPLELLMCLCDHFPDRKDVVNLSATCKALRIPLFTILVRQDLRSNKLLGLKYGLSIRNMRVVEPFFECYRRLKTCLMVTTKEEGAKTNANIKATLKRTDDGKSKTTEKAGSGSDSGSNKRKRAPPPPPPKILEISFWDERLPCIRHIRPLLTSALEKALLVHDLTFAEQLLWHSGTDKHLLPSLTPVLESVLWTAFYADTNPQTSKAPNRSRAGPFTPVVWTLDTCPLAAVKLLVKFEAKANRAGLLPKPEKFQQTPRGHWLVGGNTNVDTFAFVPPFPLSDLLSPSDLNHHLSSETDEEDEARDLYDGYYHPRTQTPEAHAYKPAMPSGRLWTGLERVALFIQESYERASKASSPVTPVAASASAGASPAAKKKGTKRNSPELHNPRVKQHRFCPVRCEGHAFLGDDTCFRQLIEILRGSTAGDEAFRVENSTRSGRLLKAEPSCIEYNVDNMLKITEDTVPFAKMVIPEQARKLFKEVADDAEERKNRELEILVEKGLEKNKKLKTKSMPKSLSEEEEEDFWQGDGEWDFSEGEPEDDEE